jgi:hypothetical protein
VVFPPRPRQAGDESCPNRISGACHHDRERARGVLGCTGRCGSYGHKHVDVEPDQLGRQVGEPFILSLCPTVLDDEVLALDIAEVAQPLPEGIDRGITIRAGKARTEPPDPVHFPRRLCDSDQRCHEHTQGERHDDPDGTAPHGRLLALSVYPPFTCHMKEAERWRSPAAGSGSEARADAGGSQVQRFVSPACSTTGCNSSRTA